MRTLVVHLGALGDFILACPAIAHLATDGPVSLLGAPARHALAVTAGLATRAVDGNHVDFHTAFTSPSDRLLAFLAEFDRAVVWMRDADPVLTALRSAGVPNVVAHPGLPGTDWARPASDYYLDCVGAPPGATPCLALGDALPGWDIVVQPGSGSARKNWPMAHFAEVAARLAQEGRVLTWLAGPAEEALAYPAGVVPVHEPDLVTLGRRLAGARLYLGNDSGVSHLAAAVGCASVVVFGPTNAAVWAPRGTQVRVVQGDPWPSVDDVVTCSRAVDSAG